MPNKPPAAAAGEAQTIDLLDQVIAATRPQSDQEAARAKDYFRQFLNQVVKPGQVVSKDVETNVKHWIGQIDKMLSAQTQRDHAPSRFPEAGIDLARAALSGASSETGENLKIRVLNVSKRELFKDLEKAAEFDQSALFKKIYEEEYGQLGGQPYGMLVGDYEFGRTAEDISLLKMISNVAAAAHAPFVAAAAPRCSTSIATPSWPTRAIWPRFSTASNTPRGSRSANRKIRGSSG